MNPYDCVDNESNYVNGHYFAASKSEYKDIARRELLETLQSSDRWKHIVRVENGVLKFLPTGVDEYTKDDTVFRELMLLAINWTGGLTGRGTEMTSLLYKNKMTAARNVIVEDGQIVIVTEYHKSQAMMEDIKVCKK
jgi:hypothetical protein